MPHILQNTGNPSDTDTVPLSYTGPQFIHDLFGTDSYNSYYDAEEDIAQPFNEDNWYEDLQDASGLDTSPDTGLNSPPGPATAESESCHGDEKLLRSLICSSRPKK